MDDHDGIAAVQMNLGNLAFLARNNQEATARLEESLALQRALGHTWGSASILSNLGQIALGQGDPRQARLRWLESIVLYQQLGDRDGMATCLEGLAAVFCGLRNVSLGMQLYGAADAARGSVSSGPLREQSRRRTRNLAIARNRFGESEVKRALDVGHGLAVDQAMRLAQSGEQGQ